MHLTAAAVAAVAAAEPQNSAVLSCYLDFLTL